LRTEAEIDKMDGGDSGSEMAKDLSTPDADVDDSDAEKQEKNCTLIKGASKRKARSHKDSSNGESTI
jgi:hypothetical protein